MTKYLEDFIIGETSTSPARTITETDVVLFAGLSGDVNPIHTDEEFCKKNSPFGTRIAHGMLGLSVVTGLSARIGDMAGSAIAFLGIEDWRFLNPIIAGDTVHLVVETTEARPTSKPGRGLVKRKLSLINQKGEVCQQGLFSVLVHAKSN
ncbi:MAG: MaoC family dehydratase N-terminal domain-containing protein [Rhodobiaceae bacterium]|nr:MaoC family dehydratase N-terminal domain-containing protein [Rhodobiaceae bacterium]MCC0056623.1 MaoC family dehydratase N-terminal domain-containing protein [Rhodobiaceae bacterium]